MEETKCAKFPISDYVSRNANEPSKASLHRFVVVNLPEKAKPGTQREETTVSIVGATRSRMGWRA